MDDTPLTLTEAANVFPKRNGRKISIKTIKRRIVNGCRGVRLQAFKDGRTWFTTARWIREFQVACTRSSAPEQSQRLEADESREANRKAAAYLARRFGIHVTEENQLSDLPREADSLRPLRELLRGGGEDDELGRENSAGTRGRGAHPPAHAKVAKTMAGQGSQSLVEGG